MLKKIIQWIVLASLAVIVTLGFYGEFRVKNAVEKFTNQFADIASIQYEDVKVHWDGRVSVSNIVIAPHAKEGFFTINSLDLVVDNVLELVKTAEQLNYGRIPNNFRIEVDGIHSGLGNLSLANLVGLPDDNVVEEITGLGCTIANGTKNSELLALGYSEISAKIRADFKRDIDSDVFSLVLDVDTPNFVDVLINVAGRLGPENIYVRQIPNLQPSWEKGYLWINANPYIGRKLDFCAKRLGISKEAFVKRHLNFVKSWVRREAMSLSDNLYQGYEDFLLKGGDFQIQTKLEKPISGEELRSYDFNETMAWLDLNIQINQKPVTPISIRSLHPKPFMGEANPEDQPKEFVPKQYRLTLIENLEEYLRWPIKIKLKNGEVLEGRLDDITQTNIAIDRRIGSGNYAMYVPVINIEAVWVQR